MATLHHVSAALAAAMIATAGASAAANPTPPHATQCFASNTWTGWSAPGEGNVLYLRTGIHDVYRVELTPGAHVRKSPDRFLVNRVHGSSWICSALDLDLTLADHQGFQQPLIARSLRKLTPTEVAAIPRKDRP